MKNTIKVLWYVIISAMVLTMFVLVSAKVFAHGDGECLPDADGNVKLGWVKIIDHLTDTELDELQDGKYEHGHLYEYYDKCGNPTGKGTGFFSIYDDAGDYFADCPLVRTMEEAGHPNTPILRPLTPIPRQPSRGRSQRSPVNSCDPVIPPRQPKTDIEESSEPEFIPPSPTCDVDFSVSGIICWNWQIEDRYQLIGFPVLPLVWDTVGWLHYSFERRLQRKNILFQVFIDERWLSYKGGGRDETNPEVGDIPITPHLAIMVNFKSSEESIGLLGTPQLGEIINLEPGIHLIGLPEVPSSYQRATDFLSVDGVEWVKIGYSPSKHIDSQDDPDDQDLQAGQAIRIHVTNAVTLDLRGTAPAAAPMAPHAATLATSWGSLKRIP